MNEENNLRGSKSKWNLRGAGPQKIREWEEEKKKCSF